jgi:putative phosphoesterase
MLEVRRVGLIGDVHTESVRLRGVLAHFRAQNVDRILCTGDIPDGRYGAREVDACCALLAASSVLTVSGNHDRWLQDNEQRDLEGATERDELAATTLQFLAQLPATLSLQTPSGELLLCHGTDNDDMAGVQPFDRGVALENNGALQHLLHQGRYRYVVAGHTHRAMVRTIEGLILINPGTLLEGHTPCCAIADLERKRIEFFDVAEDGSVTQSGTTAL